jgi:uncharacterized protein YkwD
VPESGGVRRSALIAVAAVFLAAGGAPVAAAEPAAASCAGADQPPAALTVTQTRAAITCLLNAARATRHAPALRGDVRLARAAQRFARALDPAKPLTHDGSGATTPLDRIAEVGYPRGGSFSAAETLGRSHGALATPAQRVKSWLAGASTRHLLLSARYRDVGIGVVTRGDVTTFVVEVAARSASASSKRASGSSSRAPNSSRS